MNAEQGAQVGVRTRRRLLRRGVGLVAVGGGGLLAACGAQRGESAPPAGLTEEAVNLQVAHNFPWRGQAAFDESVRTFQAKYANIKVIEVASAGDYNEKMVTMFAGGTSPDVMQVNNDAVPDFAGRGILRPLDPFVTRDKRDITEYQPFALRIYRYASKQFCLPEILNMTLAFANKAVFDERGIKLPPSDWKDRGWTTDTGLWVAAIGAPSAPPVPGIAKQALP